jgi:methylmalonyl-CoA mutase cobalamin-binding subunit
MPALHEIGEAWADGRISVAGEHLVASAVQRRLAAAYEAAARSPQGAGVIVGLPPGSHHELGILAFATAARRVGLAVTYLGANLPSQGWLTAITRNRAQCAVLALPQEQDLDGLTAVVTDIRKAHPEYASRSAAGANTSPPTAAIPWAMTSRQPPPASPTISTVEWRGRPTANAARCRACFGLGNSHMVRTTVEMLRAATLTVACPPFTLIGWLAALAFCEVR